MGVNRHSIVVGIVVMKPFWEPEVGRRYRLLRRDGAIPAGEIIEVIEIREDDNPICLREHTLTKGVHGIREWSVKGAPGCIPDPFFEHIPG